MLVHKAAAVRLELKLDMLGSWQMMLQAMLRAWSAERLPELFAERLGMDWLLVVVRVVSKVVSKTCVDTSRLLKTSCAP